MYVTFDQLLEDILKQYYMVWKAGYKKACISNLEESLKAFLQTLTESQHVKEEYVVKRFITWPCENNAPASEASVNEFLKQYKLGRNLKASSISFYKDIFTKIC